ncbi:hypothetical protein [Frankia sp. Cas3]|uniref:hypothetical protein n=1 Tax=Frankia sp. Cas3 TaxID=3073926 RepID=UPI002AD25369|nr:hypothetical protein [Frankia sp. Cas3]
MPATTIKVDSAVRDRLARVARARGVTMGALLQGLSLDLQAQQEWADIEAAYERFRRDDPACWAEYLTELSEWGEVSADPGNTSDEWPEFNT